MTKDYKTKDFRQYLVYYSHAGSKFRHQNGAE